MASLTSWPTNGRASTLVSFFATEAALSRSPGTRTPRPASSPSVATRTSATRSLRPGMPSQRAARARRPVPSSDSCFVTSAAVVGSATSRRSKGGATGSAGRSCPLGRGGDHRLGALGRRAGAAGDGLAEGAGVEQLLQPAPHRLHLEALEGGLRRGPVPAAEGQLVDVDVERHVEHERDDAGVGAGQLLVLGQVLAQLGRLLVEVGEDAVEVAVLGQQLGRGLLAHARDARQVVRGVAAQRRQQHVLRRRHAGAVEDALPRRRARSR